MYQMKVLVGPGDIIALGAEGPPRFVVIRQRPRSEVQHQSRGAGSRHSLRKAQRSALRDQAVIAYGYSDGRFKEGR